jgi:hypothetical protein
MEKTVQSHLKANAGRQAPLEAVACTPWLGKGSGTHAGYSLLLLAGSRQGNRQHHRADTGRSSAAKSTRAANPSRARASP